MKTWLLSSAAVLAMLAAVPAKAALLDVTYDAVVSIADGTTANTGLADGQVVHGEFLLDTAGNVLRFSNLAGYAAPTDGTTTAAIPFSYTSATFALGTYASAGAPLNDSVTVGLFPTGVFDTTDPAALLQETNLNSQLDFTGSPFGSEATFLLADAASNNPTRVVAYLTDISVSVPEPATMAILATAIGALVGVRRRRA
jgi:hypothetical protein